MNLSVISHRRDPWAVVSVAGEIDVYTAGLLRESLVNIIASGSHYLVVDMTGVTFLDSTGLGVLVGAMKRVRSEDGALRIVCAEPKIVKVFEITGLTQVFPMFATVDDATL